MGHWRGTGALGALLVVGVASSCGTSSPEQAAPPPPPAPPSTLAMLDPATCAGCHADHYRAWSGSMHAYAGEDPVFIAMNARGQRETNGALGSFCVTCHAPVALAMGATTDGLNLATLPAAVRGVTCYFCHSVDRVIGDHNNALGLATDGVLRASIKDPQMNNGGHGAAYAPLFDRNRIGSAALCGSCHDVTNQHGFESETTFKEWQKSLFASAQGPLLPGRQPGEADPGLTCAACHMPESTGVATQQAGAPERRIHDHAMPAIDLALKDFPQLDDQKRQVQQLLDSSLVTKLCVSQSAAQLDVEVSLGSTQVGHTWPSGATHDRRAWVELVATAGSNVVYKSGVVADGQSVDALADPDLWVLKQKFADENGGAAPFLWQARTSVKELLPAMTTSGPKLTTRHYKVPTADSIAMRVQFLPIALDTLDDLVASGDLDPAIRKRMTTMTVAPSVLKWSADRGFGCVP